MSSRPSLLLFNNLILALNQAARIMPRREVAKPNVVPVTPHLTLVEAIARAGGITDNADLPGSLLIRNGQAQPVNYERLLRKGEASQNIVLEANDVVLIPNVTDRKVFVLGEVARPQTLALRTGTGRLDDSLTDDQFLKTVVVCVANCDLVSRHSDDEHLLCP